MPGDAVTAPTTTERTTGRRQVSLGTRIFLATATLVALTLGAAVLITWWQGNRIGTAAAREAVERSGKVQDTFQERRFQLLALIAEQLAGDPNFSAYVAESIEQGDVLSLLDQLDERRSALGFDFALILDPDGLVVARTDAPEATGEDLSAEPLYHLAFDGYEAIGVWAQGEDLYYAVGVPVAAGGLLHGFLVAAYAIDDRAANELREINNTEVVYLRTAGQNAPVAVASTLAPSAVDDLLSGLGDGLLDRLGDGDSVQGELTIQRQQSLAVVRPVRDIADQRVGLVVHMASIDVQLAPYRLVGRILLWVGLVAMLLAFAFSFLLPKRILQPMLRLTAAAKAAAEGDYDQPIAVDQGDEVGQLASAFSSLLSELREKRDMETYVNELARSVPEAEGASPEAEPASRRDLVLLGIEQRPQTATPSDGGDAGEHLDLLARDVRRIGRLVSAQGGKLESFFGNRLVASFEGKRRAERALWAIARLGEGKPADEGLGSLALALTAGSVVSGTVVAENRPGHTLSGEPITELEALLRLAKEGSLLVSGSARQELSETLEQGQIPSQEYQSTVTRLPLFSLDPATLGKLVTSDHTPTQQMTATLGQRTGLGSGPQTLSGIGIGAVLGGRFEILSELGAGGMGVVYKARDRSLGELVALKMLKADMWSNPEHLERLKEELRLARKISHPNILRTFDFGDADGLPFISMEFVRGITLRGLLDRSGRLPLSAGLRTARQLCRGLIAAHAEGVLHRDIKPENLIIEHTGNLKLMDFGIARPLQRSKQQTEPGAVVGTPFYLAPEQLEGLEPDQRADLYAAGVVLYEIFTGALPFATQGNIFEIIARKLQEPPTPPREHWPTMPDALVDIVMRCLSRDRDRRQADVATLLQQLDVLRA